MRQRISLEENMNLLLRAERIPYQRQYKFHPTRKWAFDFALPEHLIAIECDGIFRRNQSRGTSGGHTTPSGYRKTIEKQNAAVAMGWTIFRVLPSAFAPESSAEEVIKVIMAKINGV